MTKYLSTESWKTSDKFLITKESERIIKTTQKNITILAGPGAGKTEILAQRANFLLQTGACKSPQKILALSFKVDSASNIKKRVDLRCGQELSNRFDSYTFDALFISLVHRFRSLLPNWIKIPFDFDVCPFDNNWWHEYEQIVLEGQPCNDKKLFSPLDLTEKPKSEIVKIWDYCTNKKVMDYAMCRSMAYTIVKNNTQIKNIILSTYKYLFLDEFQDTTSEQYDFIKAVFKSGNTIITAVGDTNQAIMGWAGANLENFDNLKKDFGTEIAYLTANHRSNSKIASLINYIIKNLTPKNETPGVYKSTSSRDLSLDCIGAKSFDDVKEEAEYISGYINLLMKKSSELKHSDFSIILRQKAEDYFNRANDIFKNNGLTLRNEDKLVTKNGMKIQDLMADPLSIFLVLLIRKKVRFIDYRQEKELERIASAFSGYDIERDIGYKNLQEYISVLELCIDLSIPIENSVSKILKKIGKTKIKVVYPQYSTQYSTKVRESFCILFQEAIDKNPNNQKLAITNYQGMNQVKLMTIHKSKGLEFNTVFFVDFHDKAWWGLRDAVKKENKQKQEEEKRSFFVGLSRAKERLFFTKSEGDWPPVIARLLTESGEVTMMPDLQLLS
jgi:superfamily I DNA/RNA helicase